MFKKIILVFLILAFVLTLILLSISKQKKLDKWKTYTNDQLKYSIAYPDSWTSMNGSNNGDERILYKDTENQIIIYATNKPSTFSTQDAPTERSRFKLNNGETATKLILKDDNKNIRYIVFFEKNGIQYVFNALISEKYYLKNKNLLDQIAKSFKTF